MFQTLEHSEDDAEFRVQPGKTRRVARPNREECNRYHFKWLISTPNSSIRACLFTKCSLRTLKMADGGQKADLCWRNTAKYGFVLGLPNTSYESFIFALWITFKCVKGGELISKSRSLRQQKGYCGKRNNFSGGIHGNVSNLLGGLLQARDARWLPVTVLRQRTSRVSLVSNLGLILTSEPVRPAGNDTYGDVLLGIKTR